MCFTLRKFQKVPELPLRLASPPYVTDIRYWPGGRALFGIEHEPTPPWSTTVHVAAPTWTVAISPFGTGSPLPALTVTENVTADSSPKLTFVELALTMTLVQSLTTRNPLALEVDPNVVRVAAIDGRHAIAAHRQLEIAEGADGKYAAGK